MSLTPGSSPPESPITPEEGDCPSPLLAMPVQRTGIPSLRSLSDPSAVPAPLSVVHAERRVNTFSTNTLPKDVQARLAAFQASRNVGQASPSSKLMGAHMHPQNGRVPPMGGMNARPTGPLGWASAPAIPGRQPAKASLGQRRGLKLPSGLPGAPSEDSPTGNGTPTSGTSGATGSLFNKYSDFVDANTGTLKFAGKAIIHGKGVDFSSGRSFSISLDEIEKIDELGKGNYGTVFKVIHRKPNQVLRPLSRQPSEKEQEEGVVMAMKEIRLELDEAKFAQIIMELDILHKCRSPYIVEFYGAFFQEGAVYICMEHMDGGSIDKLYKDGVPEGVLRKITHATVQGLKTLKDDHNIIHRDVKPTNILVNTNGEIKLCDFGVSGNLVASIAKTNIGCQSYMAPERIANGGMQAADTPGTGTYSVQSDIWSLGLSILECAMGCYPYPPETYNNIFSQLSAIVEGVPPDLPEGEFTEDARDFVRGCLNKVPKLRPTYAMLLNHAWIGALNKPSTISEEEEESDEQLSSHPPTQSRFDKEVADWVIGALDRRRNLISNGQKADPDRPALHAAPLDNNNGLPEVMKGLRINGYSSSTN
ncbi:MAP kinase [Peziza echinospora]|nr:MAP kinase [Peziza echinospora]